MSRVGPSNRTNYYRFKAPGLSYRKHVDWKQRQAHIAEEGFDNEKSHGIIRLPDPGNCHSCGDKIITDRYRKPISLRGKRR